MAKQPALGGIPADKPLDTIADPPSPEPALDIPAGSALFENPTDLPVKVALLDGANRPRAFRWKPGGRELAPVEYVQVVLNRAPMLKLLGSRPSEAPDAG